MKFDSICKFTIVYVVEGSWGSQPSLHWPILIIAHRDHLMWVANAVTPSSVRAFSYPCCLVEVLQEIWSCTRWSKVHSQVVVPPGIRSESQLALRVTRRPRRDRLGELDSWVMFASPGKKVCLENVFLPSSELLFSWSTPISVAGLWAWKKAA